MINKFFMHILYGVVIFILGAILRELMGLRSLGNFISSLGITYPLIVTAIIVFKYKPLTLMNRVLNDKYGSLSRLPNILVEIAIKCWLFALPFIAFALLLHAKTSASIGIVFANAGTACFGLAIFAKLIHYCLPKKNKK